MRLSQKRHSGLGGGVDIELKRLRKVDHLTSEYEPPLGVGGCPPGFNLLRDFWDFLNLLRKNVKFSIFARRRRENLGFYTVSSSFPLRNAYFSAPAAG